MRIIEPIEIDDRKFVKLNSGLAADYMDLLECLNPFCDCGDCYGVIMKREDLENTSAEGMPIQLNVYNGKIGDVKKLDISNSLKSQVTKYKEFIENHLSNEDWKVLHDIYKEHKRDYIDDLRLNEIEFDYNFSVHHLANIGSMISYQEIFPACRVFKIEKEGIEYKVVEQYCKNIRCGCTKINIQVFDNGELKGDFNYDYKTDNIDNQSFDWVLSRLKSENIGWKEYIQIRNLQIKNLYAKNLLRINENQISKSHLRKPIVKIGRNDQCPCGSGKKFKKCCINN